MGEIRNYLVANPIQYIQWVKCESRSNEYHNARARSPWRKRKLEERRRTTPSVIIANGGNSIGESLSIGCFLTATLSTPHSPATCVSRQQEWDRRPRKFFDRVFHDF